MNDIRALSGANHIQMALKEPRRPISHPLDATWRINQFPPGSTYVSNPKVRRPLNQWISESPHIAGRGLLTNGPESDANAIWL